MSEASGCPSPEALRDLLKGELPESRAREVRAHIMDCAGCAEAMERMSVPAAAAPAYPTVPGLAAGPASVPQTERSLEAVDLEETPAPSSPTLSLGRYDFLSPAQQADELGRLGPYRVLKVLGEGGMGIVFQAEDPGLERLVALKVMKPEGAADEVSRKRFLMEGKLAAAIQHDHIVSLYQVGESNGVPFLAMQFLEGEPLDRRLKRDGKQPVGEVLRIGREVAEGLAAAHAKGLVHRDIKPANIWLEAMGGKLPRAKILDFGLARGVGDKATHLTRTGVIMGTPDYMAPEQARGIELDARCDLFSLGCVMYHMATGRKPFHGDDVMATLLALATEEPVAMRQLNPDLPWDVEERIKALMAKNPGDRPRDARAVVDELAHLEKHVDELDAPPPSSRRNAVAPAGPVAPGGLPRAGRRAPRRTVNPNASVDELLGGSGKPPVKPPPTTTWTGKPAAKGPDTAPLNDGLADWSGENAPLAAPPAPKKAPPRSDATASIGQPDAPTKQVPRAFELSTKLPPAAPAAEVSGACPACGSRRFGKSGVGWCQVCGYTVGAPGAAHDAVAAIQEQYRQERSKTWIWTVLLGAVVIAGATIGLGQYLTRGSPAWSNWVVFQFTAAVGSVFFSYIWAYTLVWQYHDDSHTALPMFLTPLRFARAVWKQSYKSKQAVCLGVWGLSASIAIVHVAGGLSYFWRAKPMGMQVPARTSFGMQAVGRDKQAKQAKCAVIGYNISGDQMVSVVLAEKTGGTLKYVGLADRVAEGANNSGVAFALVNNGRAAPIVSVPGVAASWCEPKVMCTVEYHDCDGDGILINPIVIGWDKR